MGATESHSLRSDLYRCFSERSHADEFLSGRIRFGYLQHYRTNYEGARRDVDEGSGRIREWREDRKAAVITGSAREMVDSPGEVTVDSECGNPVFICCLTAPPDDKWAPVIGDFGEFVVRISDPQRFCSDIQAALSDEDQWQHHARVEVFLVEYSKDELVPTRDAAQRQNDAIRLAIAQKLPKYSHQFEHRIALISYAPIPHDVEAGGLPPEYLYVNIGRPLEYAALVRRPRRGMCRRLAEALGLIQKSKDA
ncbi:MAG: hypothetical protein HYY78_11535 [Betaproteobacteria bacterium]|nr:hypothetical protein [Betaproteobacteria bacterium]